VKKRRRPEAPRLGCFKQLLLMGLLWGIFVGFNTVVRKVAPSLEFRIGQISVMGFALAAAELIVAWWVSLKIANAVMNGMIARAEARDEQMERIEAEEAAKRQALAEAVQAEAAKEEQ